MRLLIHLASAYFARAGHPEPGSESAAAEHARGAVLADVDRLAADAGAHNVIVAVPARGEPFRRSLAKAWRREQDEGGDTARGELLWAGLDLTAAMLRQRGAVVLTPQPFAAGRMLEIGGDDVASVGGTVASSRDVIATIARQHREAADGSTLRIVTTRPSVAALLDTQHSIDVVLLVDGAWKVVSEGKDLAAWKRWPGSEKLRVPRALLADYEALALLPGIGDGTALALLRDGDRWRDGGALAAVRAAVEGRELHMLPARGQKARKLGKGVVDTLRELGERGARELLAVAALRSDVAIQEAPSAPEVSDGVRDAGGAEGERGRAVRDPRDGLHEGSEGVRPAAQGDAREGGAGAEGAEGQQVAPLCTDCGAPLSEPHGPRCLSPEAHAPARLHGEGVTATGDAYLDGREAAHTLGADLPPSMPTFEDVQRHAEAPAICDRCASGNCDGCRGQWTRLPSRERVRCTHVCYSGRVEPPVRNTKENRQTMSNQNAIARRETHAAEMTTPGDFGAEHMRIVREAFAPNATQTEFEVMWASAKARGLDPVKKQIFFVKRWDSLRGEEVWSSQVSIDGFRSIAESSERYDGQDEPEYEYDASGALVLARVRVWKKGVSRPFVGVARWNEYVQTKKNGEPTHMWRKMEHTMLAKCAEALALRKAFPERLGGLYTSEEMEQASNEAPPAQWRQEPKAPALPAPLTAKDLMDRIPRAETSSDIFEIVKLARSWPRVRAHAWLRLLTLSSGAEIEQTRALYEADDLPAEIVAKLDAAADEKLGGAPERAA